MNHYIARILLLSLTLTAMPVLAHGGHGDEFKGAESAVTEGTIQVAPEVQRTIGLKVAPVTTRALNQGFVTTGRIEAIPALTTEVNAPLAGRLLQVLVRQGAQVKVGQPLATLDSPEIRQLQVTAQQQKAQLQAERVRLQAQLTLALANYNREKELFAGKVSAQRDLQQAQAEYVSAQANLRATQSQLQFIDAPLQARLAQLGSVGKGGIVTLRAPQSGYIATQTAANGEAVEPGRELFQLVNTRQVWAVADVYEKDAAQVRLGQSVEVSIPGKKYSGTIAVVDPIVNADTRTLKVRAVLANPQGELKPGTFASIQVIQGKTTPVTVIPQSAVLEVEGQTIVYVKNGDEFVPTVVQLGSKVGTLVAVDGLFEGDEVVTERVFQLRAQGLRGDNKAEPESKPEVQTTSSPTGNFSEVPLWGWLVGGFALVGAFVGGMGVARQQMTGAASTKTRPQLKKES